MKFLKYLAFLCVFISADACADTITVQPPGSSVIWKKGSYTGAQTGTTIWDPAAGRKIAVTSLVIGTAGTTAGRVTIWYGATADTTFTDGTDQDLFDGDLTPTSTGTPGVIITPYRAFYSQNADYELKVTTSAGITVRIIAYGYEF